MNIDLYAVYRGFKSMLKHGECSLTIRDGLRPTDGPEVTLHWRTRTDQEYGWREVLNERDLVMSHLSPEDIGRRAGMRVAREFERRFETAREPDPAGYSDAVR